jgi:hypothetical protein
MEKAGMEQKDRSRPAAAKYAAKLLFIWMLMGVCGSALAQVNYPVQGSFTGEYRYRSTEGASDQDAYQYLNLDLGDPSSNAVTGHFFGRLAEDVGGRPKNDEYYPFADIMDTDKTNLDARLYIGYVDINKIQGIDRISLGRMMVDDTPVWLWLDGARVETAEIKKLGSLKFGAYGGVPVHLYDPETSDNTIYGAFAQARPWLGGRIRFDWTHADEKYLYGNESNDFYALSLWQAIDSLMVNARYTMLGDQSHDAQARATWYSPKWGVMVQGYYYSLLIAQKNLAIEFDPFFAALHEYYPYQQAGFLASKELGKHFRIDAGGDFRRLLHREDMGSFNHDYDRYFLTLSLLNLPVDKLEISATGEIWNSVDQVEWIESYGGDVSYRISKPLKVSVGTYYELYKYDYYIDEELDRTQTYYARISYHPAKGLGGGLRYEYEDSALGDFQTVRAEISYAF